ncbi:MAG: hypothetical protein A3J49_00930 [Gallionellales bacterium RIFCSPHIGHO2_02_FULL_57_16]|nr:MAG: hypothetical protein A3J49_00930 [Gallionellales bacterium RIFCSPHIGHO2_02_FULL_57_16]
MFTLGGGREFDHAVFMEDVALFASIGLIRIGNMGTKRQRIRQVVPEYPAPLPVTSRYVSHRFTAVGVHSHDRLDEVFDVPRYFRLGLE